MTSLLSIVLLAGLGASEAPPVPNSITLVSHLTEQASAYCIDEQKTVWLHPHFELGFVRITASAEALARYVNKPVVVVGRPNLVSEAQTSAPGRPGQCHIAQMRSDWVQGRDGMRVKRTPPLKFRTIAVDSVQPWKTVSAALEGEEIELKMRSPLPSKATLNAKVHYEGCMGKPGTTSVSKAVELTTDTDTVVRFPVLQRGGGRAYVARALSIHSVTDSVVFSLNSPLRDIGLPPVECPNRR